MAATQGSRRETTRPRFIALEMGGEGVLCICHLHFLFYPHPHRCASVMVTAKRGMTAITSALPNRRRTWQRDGVNTILCCAINGNAGNSHRSRSDSGNQVTHRRF